MTGRTLALALLAVLVLPAGAQQAAGSARVKRKDLQRIQKQLEEKNREIGEYKRQSEQLQQDLSKLAVETSDSRRKVQALEGKIREAERRKKGLQATLGAVELAEGRWQKAMESEIRQYVMRRAQRSEYYGRDSLWEESLRRSAILEKARYVSELHGVRRKTEAAAARLNRQKSELQARTGRALIERRAREDAYSRTRQVYWEAEQKLAETRKQVEELQNSALALTHLVRALESKTPYKGEPIPLAEAPHSLPWPVEGRVISAFGRQLVPGLHTWIINQGIRIAAPEGAAVRPVKAGRVIFAGMFRSYKQVIIVDHGQQFYSIYGMLGSMLKRRGEAVRASDALGQAGDSAVYFEIRHSGDALDPLHWLQKR